MMLLADIASGESDTADILFLVAFVFAVLATVAYLVTSEVSRFAPALVAGAVAAISLGWLVL